MINSRERLGFVDAVNTEFAFLVEDYGFSMEVAAPTLVRYATNDVVITIFHGRRSYVVGCEMAAQSRAGDAAPPFRLAELLELHRALCELPQGFLQASTRGGTKDAVQRIAGLLKKHGHRVLSGDPFEFQRLAVVRTEMAMTDARTDRLRNTRFEADLAWKSKNLGRIIELYSSMLDDLSASEKAKLRYARDNKDRR